MKRGDMRILILCLSLASAGAVQAQAVKPDPPVKALSPAEVAAIELPDMKFTATPLVVEDYEKYFYFHRAATSFDEAIADIRECEFLSSGIRYRVGGGEPYAGYYAGQYGVGGAIGGAIGAVLADALFGAPERRRIQRISLRNCMGFKEYKRYGLTEELWKALQGEGSNTAKGDAGDNGLLMRAKLASFSTPDRSEIEP